MLQLFERKLFLGMSFQGCLFPWLGFELHKCRRRVTHPWKDSRDCKSCVFPARRLRPLTLAYVKKHFVDFCGTFGCWDPGRIVVCRWRQPFASTGPWKGKSGRFETSKGCCTRHFCIGCCVHRQNWCPVYSISLQAECISYIYNYIYIRLLIYHLPHANLLWTPRQHRLRKIEKVYFFAAI